MPQGGESSRCPGRRGLLFRMTGPGFGRYGDAVQHPSEPSAVRRLLICLAVLAAFSGPAAAQTGTITEREIVAGVFSAAEKRIFGDYYRTGVVVVEPEGKGHGKGKDKGVPPGLAKKNGLPPGIAKKGKLPPGIAKKALPGDLLGRLPAPRVGTDRIIVDNDVLLIELATGVVLDVIEDIVSR